MSEDVKILKYVVRRSSSLDAAPGEKFIIKAADPPERQKFDEWKLQQGDAEFENKNSPETIVTMGSEPSVVCATYVLDSSNQGKSGKPNKLTIKTGLVFEEDNKLKKEITQLRKQLDEIERKLRDAENKIAPEFKETADE